jgi:DNA-binding SARP family transcriptional activator
VPLADCASRGYHRLLQDVRLDFIDRLTAERRDWLLAAYREEGAGLSARPAAQWVGDLLSRKLARAEGLLLRDGADERVPGIVLAALGATVEAAPDAVPTPAGDAAAGGPAVVLDVLTGEFRADGAPVKLPRREYEVLANLVLKGRRVPYDVLLEEVWGDADGDYAKLKVTVGRLRKRLGSGTVRSIDAGYAAGPNVSCTMGELERLATAPRPAPAALARLDAMRLRYRRELGGAARNWRWYTEFSAKTDALVERAALALGAAALEERRHAVALERAQDAIALDPVSQDAHELGLRALVAQGNAVGARQLLSAYAATLRGTLGMPVPNTLARIVRDVAS